MSTEYETVLLSDSWDLTLDGNGDIAIASGEYAAAQDSASACLTFYGECYYNNTLGIPWDTNVLGHRPSGVYIAQKMENEAKKLPVVEKALCTVYFDRAARQVKGNLRITTIDGDEAELTI